MAIDILSNAHLSSCAKDLRKKSSANQTEDVGSLVPSQHQMSNSFEKWYFESWHKYPLKKSAIQRSHYEVLKWATQNPAFSLRGKGRVALDVGCGHGYTVALLKALGFEAYGCDLSTLFLKSYAKNVAENLILCDAQNMAFRKDCLDVIVAFDMVEHLTRIAEFLKSCYMALRSKGVLVITTSLGVKFLDFNGLRTSLFTKLLLGTTNVEGHVTVFRSVKELQQVLKFAGFSFIKIELWWFAPLPFQLFRRYVAVKVPTFIIPHFRCVAIKSH